MNIDNHCTINIHEFAALEGWYWEITVPGKIHPEERIKEFILDDPGLGWLVKLEPVAVSRFLTSRDSIYKGVISDGEVANAIRSSLAMSDYI